MAVSCGVGQSALATVATLPGKLDFDPVVAVGRQVLARHANDQGGLAAADRWLGVNQLALAVCARASVRHCDGQYQGGVAVEDVVESI